MLSPLHPILAPQSVAVIGASADPTKRGFKAVQGLIRDGFAGAVYPVNPKEQEILGLPVVASIEDLPTDVDLALICTPAATLPDLVQRCGARGVKGAVVLASGFSEVDAAGAELEQAMLDAARRTGIRLIGPNTSGVFNLHSRLNLLALQNVRPGKVGIISQSGNMLLSLALEAESNGHIGFSTYVGPGNQSDLDFADYLQYLAEDEHTGVATLYVEGFKQGKRFLEVARQTALKKPLVVYKSGSTEAGQRAASSHTGALAGSYAMNLDLLRQAGATVVSQSDEILPVAEGLSLLPQARGNRVAVLADGGGQATIASDRLSEAGLELAELSDETRHALRQLLLPQASLVNPVDVAGSSDSDPAVLAECLAVLNRDSNVDMVFLVGMFGGYSLRFDSSLEPAELAAAEAMAQLQKQSDKPLVVYSLYSHVRPRPLIRLRESGLPVYDSIEHAVKVMAALAERGDFLRRAVRPEAGMDLSAQAEAMLNTASEAGRNLLEPEARALLRAYDVELPQELLLKEDSDLDGGDTWLADQPLAMKVVSEDILHKSDAGGVRLNLQGRDALLRAREEILSSCRAYSADARIEGVMLTPMARPGTEVIIGMSRDPVFGPVLMFGLGGIFVELLADVAFRAVPLSREDAAGMLAQIKAQKVLQGARGAEVVDQEALIGLLLKVSALVENHPQIEELDLNPVIARADGCSVVDARVIVKRAAVN